MRRMLQRSKEWHDARRGIITASRLADVIASRGSKRRQLYLNELTAAIQGAPSFDDEEVPPWFQHGVEWEDEARGAYEFEMDTEVEEVGLIINDEYTFVGCSPDGLVGKDGGIEIKCSKSIKQFLKAQSRGLPSQYKAQVQGCLWITGRDWWDFVAYFKTSGGDMRKSRMAIHRVERDEPYIERLTESCLEFWKEAGGAYEHD